jgi:hypothetical protein
MQNFKPLPSREEILSVVHYDPATGYFIRRLSKQCPWLSGKRTGSVAAKGYRLLHINNKYYMEHRIAWVVVYGVIPLGMTIDHINGDKGDNRIANLRLATDSENSCYRPKKSNNTSGCKGVYQRENGKYRAVITSKKQKISLGTFNTKEEAYAAYCEAARRLHGEFAQLD